MTEFILIRHGEPDYTRTNVLKFKGHGNDLAPLTVKGAESIKQISTDEIFKKAEIILVSPYTRTMQTAAILNRKLNLDMIVDIDLREWTPDNTYQFSDYDTVLALIKEFEDNNGIHPKGTNPIWESMESLRERASNALDSYKGKYKCVLVVCHCQVIRALTGKEMKFGEYTTLTI